MEHNPFYLRSQNQHYLLSESEVDSIPIVQLELSDLKPHKKRKFFNGYLNDSKDSMNVKEFILLIV
jgi:hypothetical protein